MERGVVGRQGVGGERVDVAEAVEQWPCVAGGLKLDPLLAGRVQWVDQLPAVNAPQAEDEVEVVAAVVVFMR